MIDLHNHILPGIDDGPRSLSESLAIAEIASEDGITGIVCTPHFVEGYYENRLKSVLVAVKTLNEQLVAHDIFLDLYPGAELRLDDKLPSRIEAGEVLTFNDNGRYALIEVPEDFPPSLEKAIWKIQSIGITPVISHPERNEAFYNNPQRLYNLVKMGSLTQITAASLLGRFGREIREFSLLLLEHRLTHVIATDAHDYHYRTPKLRSVVKEAERIVGADLARRMVTDIPKMILEGVTINAPEPIPLGCKNGKTSAWRRFIGSLGIRCSG